MLVSVIVPVYNVEPFLKLSIDSLINQTYSEIEILLIDDGSTDKSGKICDDYAEIDNRIRVVHQNNAGLSNARNVGFDLSKGDVVAFLDSDDIMRPDFLKTMIEAMFLEDTDIVVCKYTNLSKSLFGRWQNHKKKYPLVKEGTYDSKCALRLLAEGRINAQVWNKIYRREIWGSIRFSDGHVYEDGEIALKVLNMANKIHVLDKPLYIYRRCSGAITDVCTKESIKDWLRSYSIHEEYLVKRIPLVYTEENLRFVQQLKLDQMTRFYLCYKDKDKNAKRKYCSNIRKDVITLGKKIEIKGIRANISFSMIRYVPWLLKILYPLYHKLRKATL